MLDFVEKGFIADLQIGCGELPVPASAFERLRNGGGFCASLQVAHQVLEALFAIAPVAGRCGGCRAMPWIQLIDDRLLPVPGVELLASNRRG